MTLFIQRTNHTVVHIIFLAAKKSISLRNDLLLFILLMFLELHIGATVCSNSLCTIVNFCQVYTTISSFQPIKLGVRDGTYVNACACITTYEVYTVWTK